MEVGTTLSKTLHTARSHADYDAACKRLLSEKVILAWIMKNCLKEYRNCSIQEIMDNYIEGEPQIAKVPVTPDETNIVTNSMIKGLSTEDKTITEGTVTYDIRFLATAPKSKDFIRLILNIEAQNDFYPGYPLLKRGIYYCSRMISAQYGTEFTASHYENIKKVYSIWICPNPPKKWENTITEYSIAEKQLVGHLSETPEHYDLLSTILICLGNSNSQNYTGVLKLLDVLLCSKKTPDEKEQILHDDFNIKMTQNLKKEVSLMCNLSKGVEEQGMQTATFQALQNLMDSLKINAEQAMRLLKIPKDEQEKYASMLKKV